MPPAAPPPSPAPLSPEALPSGPLPVSLDYADRLDPNFVAMPPLPDGPVSLTYASEADPSAIIAAAAALRWMVSLAVMSGLCVASCFMLMAAEMNPLAVAGHVLIYAITLTLAGFVGRRLSGVLPPSPLRVAFDTLAGAGLLIIGLLPVFFDGRGTTYSVAAPFLIVAAGLLAGTTYRHLLLYRELAVLFHVAGRRSVGRLLTVLGWIKTIYEGVWLSCCFVSLSLFALATTNLLHKGGEAAIMVAFGALFGAMGFTGVWVLMIVAHSIAASAAGRAARA